MKKVFESYYGGKESAGVPQTLINVIPPHLIFAEVFAGNCTLSRYINTPVKYLNDKAKGVWEKWPESTTEHRYSNLDYKDFLTLTRDETGLYLYCDPPYLMETRTSKGKRYEVEMTTIEEHTEFLTHIRQLERIHLIGISHYPHALYDGLLKSGWYKKDYESQTRAGRRKERLYLNYNPETLTELQDYRYLGEDRIDRQRIKRRIRLLSEKLEALPDLERAAVVNAIKGRY